MNEAEIFLMRRAMKLLIRWQHSVFFQDETEWKEWRDALDADIERLKSDLRQVGL